MQETKSFGKDVSNTTVQFSQKTRSISFFFCPPYSHSLPNVGRHLIITRRRNYSEKLEKREKESQQKQAATRLINNITKNRSQCSQQLSLINTHLGFGQANNTHCRSHLNHTFWRPFYTLFSL